MTQSISSSNYHFTTISITPLACRTNDFQRRGGGDFIGGERVARFIIHAYFNQSCGRRFSCLKTTSNFKLPPVFYSCQSEEKISDRINLDQNELSLNLTFRYFHTGKYRFIAFSLLHYTYCFEFGRII